MFYMCVRDDGTRQAFVVWSTILARVLMRDRPGADDTFPCQACEAYGIEDMAKNRFSSDRCRDTAQCVRDKRTKEGKETHERLERRRSKGHWTAGKEIEAKADTGSGERDQNNTLIPAISHSRVTNVWLAPSGTTTMGNFSTLSERRQGNVLPFLTESAPGRVAVGPGSLCVCVSVLDMPGCWGVFRVLFNTSKTSRHSMSSACPNKEA